MKFAKKLMLLTTSLLLASQLVTPVSVSALTVEESLSHENIHNLYGLGSHHGYYVSNQGTLYVKGDNNYGQLGVGTTTDVENYTLATHVDGEPIKGVVKIFASEETAVPFTVIQLEDGRVMGSGHNGYNSMGLPIVGNVVKFTEIEPLRDRDIIQVITTYGKHTSDGTLQKTYFVTSLILL